jgi:protein transport protein DSL1/ZW10
VLRRDINTYYIHHLLTQPTSLSYSSSKDSSGILSETLSFLPSPSTSEDLSTRLKNLTSVLDFLDAHLFTALPSSHVASFKRTLCKPVTTALLQEFLVSFLPSSLAALPPYLHLVMEAEELEEKYIVGLLGQDPRDREVKTWTDAVSSHYERKRRAQILENARQLILLGDDDVPIRVEVDLPPPAPPSSAPTTQSSGSEGAADVSDDAWGLEGEESGGTDDLVLAAEEEDAWGFDDGPVEQGLAKPGTSPESPPPTEPLAGSESTPPVDDSAWGWDDSGEEPNPPVNTSPQAPSSGNSADWDDDPWGESSNSSQPQSASSVPKPASRLEKLANKAKGKAPPSTTPTFAMKSPAATARSPPPAPSRPSKPVETSNVTLPGTKEEPKPITQADSYAISKHAQQLADIVDAILSEGEEFAAATIFDSKTPPTQARGLVISQSAPAALDLFRALYPVKFHKQSTEPKSIVFANDCIYARGRALGAARKCSDGVKDKLLDTADSLNALGKRWFEQSIVSNLSIL